jgi:hypothetical protein
MAVTATPLWVRAIREGEALRARADRLYSSSRDGTRFPLRRQGRCSDVRVLFVLSVTTLLRIVTYDTKGPLPMNLDMSVAPEIALLAVPAQGIPPGITPARRPRATLGALARELSLIASRPERWWGAVRYHTAISEHIDLGFSGLSSWVGVLVPGDAGLYCTCDLMMLVAGDAVEESVADGGSQITALRVGSMRVHGQGLVHQIRASGAGIAVTLHISGHISGHGGKDDLDDRGTGPHQTIRRQDSRQ